jgi:hypothetical protein
MEPLFKLLNTGTGTVSQAMQGFEQRRDPSSKSLTSSDNALWRDPDVLAVRAYSSIRCQSSAHSPSGCQFARRATPPAQMQIVMI